MRCSPRCVRSWPILTPRPPTIPIISTTYENIYTRPVFDAEHWAGTCAIRCASSRPSPQTGTNHHTFIEISAHPLLTQAIADTLEEAHHESKSSLQYLSIGTLQRDTDDTITFRTNLYTADNTHPPQTPHPPEPRHPVPHHPMATHPPLDHHLSSAQPRADKSRAAMELQWGPGPETMCWTAGATS